MNKISLAGTALLLAVAAGSASAASTSSSAASAAASNGGPAAGKFGVNINIASSAPTDILIKGRYLITQDMAVLAGFGLAMIDNGAANNAKSTDVAFMGGFRKYLKTDELAPFVGAGLQYLSTRDQAAAADVTNFGIGIEAGAEYFLSKQFSFEGSVGFSYVSRESNPIAAGQPTTKASQIGSGTVNLSANFYF